MKPRAAGVSRRYARALLGLALERGEAAALSEEIQRAVGLLRAQRELAAALAHPALGAERRRALALAVWGGRGPELLVRLLALLAERGRVALLPQIAAEYSTAWNEARGVVSALAVTAAPLDPRQTDALRAAARIAVGREVDLETQVDPAVLGGVLLTMGGSKYDGTLRRRLARLRGHLASGTAGT